MTEKRIAIVDGIRTPFIKAFTAFNHVPAKELGRIAFSELIARLELDAKEVDELVLGSVATTADAPNIGRVVSLLAGIPERKKAMTVSRNCASGMEAVTTAYEKILADSDEVVMAGGAESMSNVPLIYSKDVQDFFLGLRKAPLQKKLAMLWKVKWSFFKPIIGLQESLMDPVCGLNMGQTAEILAKEFEISRREQDEFALRSHKRAWASREKLREEIVPVPVGPQFKNIIRDDNGVREKQTMEALLKLKPYFERGTGTVTAGNSSQITDGACALFVTTEDRAKALGYKPLGYIRSYSYVGLDPKRMGLGPAYAIPQALKKAGVSLKDVGLVEINEAFACQVIACVKALSSEIFCREKLGLSEAVGEIDPEILNVNGGAIALGHPVGSTGSRLVLTLLKEMQRRNVNLGVASLCVGGGQGGAIILERD